jgi:hypothetical protein
MPSLIDLMAIAAAADDVLAMLKRQNPANLRAIGRAQAERNKAHADLREAFAYRARLLGVAV